MLSLALKLSWFVLSLLGLCTCWIVLGTLAIAEGSYWAPLLYCIGCTIVEGIFCIGIGWRMNPLLMPSAFCKAQAILTGFGYFVITGVAVAYSFDAIFQRKDRNSGSRGLSWRPLFTIPVILFPLAAMIAEVTTILVLDAAQPTEDLECDATQPLWVRFLGYAGVPFIFCQSFFLCSLIWHIVRSSKNRSANNQTHLTTLPQRPRKRFANRENTPQSQSPFPTGIITSPSPSNPSPAPARVPISPGLASPVLSARQFHLPFSPLSPLDIDAGDRRNAEADELHHHDDHTLNNSHNGFMKQSSDLTVPTYSERLGTPHSYSHSSANSFRTDSPVSSSFPRFAATDTPPNPSESPVPRLLPQGSMDFLRYINEYKEKEGREHNAEVQVAEETQHTRHTKNSSTLDWDDLSSLRWNRGGDSDADTYDEASSHGNVGFNDIMEVIRGGYNRASRGASLAPLAMAAQRRGSDYGYEKYYRPKGATEESYDVTETHEGFRDPEDVYPRILRVSPSSRRDSPPWTEDQHAEQSSLIWRIVKVQIPITLVLLLSSLTTLIDIIRESTNPSSFQPTSFGTQHVALLLLVWGPVFVFGHTPTVRHHLMFWRRTS